LAESSLVNRNFVSGICKLILKNLKNLKIKTLKIVKKTLLFTSSGRARPRPKPGPLRR